MQAADGGKNGTSWPDDRVPGKALEPTLNRSVRLLIAGVVIVSLAPLTLATRETNRLVNKPLTEDGFYSLSVARNLATGHGLTINGHTLTNGFQPAVTVIESIAFLDHGNRFLGLRLVLILSWLMAIATAALAALICRDLTVNQAAKRIAPWLAALALLGAPFFVASAFNGLETGGEILMYAAIWRYYQRNELNTWQRAVTIGVLLGVLILVRIDGAIFAVVLCAATYRDRTAGPSRAALAAITALIVSSPWWLYNRIEFGHFMPTSGKAEQSVMITASRIPSLIIALGQVLVPWGYASRFESSFVAALELIIAAMTVGLLVRRPRAPSRGERKNGEVARGFAFARVFGLSLVLTAAFYFVQSGATYFYGRYLAPAMLIAVIIGTAVFLNSTWATMMAVRGIAIVLVIIGLLTTAGLYIGGRAFPGNLDYSQQLALIQRMVPPDAFVGAGQSGTVGFFRDRVVNLDGKVNPEALSHQSDMPQYLSAQGINWVCDWDSYVFRYLGSNPGRRGWVEVAHDGEFGLWHRTGVAGQKALPVNADGTGPARDARQQKQP